MPKHKNNKTEFNVIKVELGERSYDIVIGSDIASQYGDLVKKYTQNGKVFIITDDNVAKYHLQMFEEKLRLANIEFVSIILPHGESTKNIINLEKILNEILSHHPNRNDNLIAFGGGVIGDITGLAASILLRGVNFIQVPTTLLSMVDSSVGGKTAINSKYGKNLIGSFYQPKIVIVDINLLKTLPIRELRAGYAEVLKYALINDKFLVNNQSVMMENSIAENSFFEFLEKDDNPFLQKNIIIDSNISDFISTIVMVSCQNKADIVKQDERESGVRALLNLGHSFGHALEAELGYDGRILHGEAIAIGMVMAFYFSNVLGNCNLNDADRVKNHILKTHLPIDLEHIFLQDNVKQKFSAEIIIKHMMHDKKNLAGNLVLILVRKIGEAYINKNIKIADVKVFLERYLSGDFFK